MFIINRTDRYRLEALVELANAYPEGRPSARVAERRAIPAPYLCRLLADLTHAGWIRSRRGPGGGVSLAHPPEAIPVTAALAGAEGINDLPPALDRLAGTIAAAVELATAGISIADLARWESQAVTTTDFSI
jgi:Rrf2 family protein